MSKVLESYRLLIAEVYELAGLSRRTSDEMAREHGQTAARWHVMSVLDEESLSVADVARRLGLAPQSVQRVVNDLKELRCVSVRPNPRDKRAPLVTLTAAGRTSHDALFAASEVDRLSMLERSGLHAAELDEARRTIRVLIDSLNA